MTLCFFVALAGAGAARAADDLGPPPSAAVERLAPAAAERAKPVYPEVMLEMIHAPCAKIDL